MRYLLACLLVVGCDEPVSGDPNSNGEAIDETREQSPASRCDVVDGDEIVCSHKTRIMLTGYSGWAPREVHYQVPLIPAPAAGYPVVFMFQGSFFSAELGWQATPDFPLGIYYQVLLTKELLDRGYAVIAPETHLNGSTYWDTNVWPFSVAWEFSADHQLMLDLFDAVADGSFGDLDSSSLFATGISSGGYMTSRMAVGYPGLFSALAIQSASYANCGGAVCYVPKLPRDHPPTLFLHGAADLVVPVRTMVRYANALATIADSERIIVSGAGHEWVPQAPTAISNFFDAH